MAVPVRIACLQMTSGRDPAANLANAEARIREAAAAGALAVFTPETTNLMELDPNRLAENAHPEAEDPTLPALCALAGELGIWLNIGSLVLKGGAGKFVNRGFWLTPDGAIAARYDKRHMFDVELPGGERYRESKTYTPGAEDAHAEFPPFGRIGLTICYDLRFPEQFRRLARAECGVISVPSAFTVGTGKAHWHVLLRARAIETGAFIVAAAQCGTHENGRRTYGHSLVVDSWGQVLADGGQAPGVVYADCDPAAVAGARARIPAWRMD